MSVIVELLISETASETLRAFSVGEEWTVVLDPAVPIGDGFTPHVWVEEGATATLEANFESAENVTSFERITADGDRVLYAVSLSAQSDDVFEFVRTHSIQVLNARTEGSRWRLEMRFPDSETISSFRQFCTERDVAFEVRRITERATRSDVESRFGLTDAQHEALVLAVERGYYDIPRRRTTVDLADELDISDQALTERLRRAITTLVERTLLGDG